VISLTLFKKFILSKRSGALIKRLAWISVIQISLSLFAFVLVLSVMNGMNLSISDRVTSLEPDLVLEFPGVSNSSDLEVQPAVMRIRENSDAIISVFEESDVIVRTMDGLYRGLVAKGLSEPSLERFSRAIQKMDQKQNSHRPDEIQVWNPDEIPGEDEVIIGFDAARTLNIFEGDWITIIPPEALILPQGQLPPLEKVRVKRIIATSLQDLDAQFLWYQKGKTLGRFKDSPSRRNRVEVSLTDHTMAESLKDSLGGFEGVLISTWKERNGALFAALKIEKLAIGFILFLAGIISSFSVVMALTLLITQKKKEWALLRTLGFSHKDLLSLITQLGLWLSSAGVLLGLFSGVALALVMQYYPLSILPSIYYDSQIPSKVDFVFVLSILVVALVICYWTCRKTAASLGEDNIAELLKYR
jgi:lipoprotein-releasing system permease protein